MKDTLQLCIDRRKDELYSLSRDIWSRPELAASETYAHDRLVRFFSQEEQTWTVRSHYELPTAFRASWGPVGGGERDPVLNVAFLCEYDALPGIGHACGHNLIAEVGAAAAVGLKAALENQTELPVPVKVTIGTCRCISRINSQKSNFEKLKSKLDIQSRPRSSSQGRRTTTQRHNTTTGADRKMTKRHKKQQQIDAKQTTKRWKMTTERPKTSAK